jgi:hypothetical protein
MNRVDTLWANPGVEVEGMRVDGGIVEVRDESEESNSSAGDISYCSLA